MSNKFKWICTPAEKRVRRVRKESKKGRTKGGIIVAVNKNLQKNEL